MNKFEDLQQMAKGVGGRFVPLVMKRTFLLFMVGFPVGVLLLYPPVFGLLGWGFLGGLAGLFASLALVQTALEIKFLITGV